MRKMNWKSTYFRVWMLICFFFVFEEKREYKRRWLENAEIRWKAKAKANAMVMVMLYEHLFWSMSDHVEFLLKVCCPVWLGNVIDTCINHYLKRTLTQSGRTTDTRSVCGNVNRCMYIHDTRFYVYLLFCLHEFPRLRGLRSPSILIACGRRSMPPVRWIWRDFVYA